jgi:hypothetical protein
MVSLRGRLAALETHYRPPTGSRLYARIPSGITYVFIGPMIDVPSARRPTPVADRPGAWRRVRPDEPIDYSRLHLVPELAVFAKLAPVMTNAATQGPGSPSAVDPAKITPADRQERISRSVD